MATHSVAGQRRAGSAHSAAPAEWSRLTPARESISCRDNPTLSESVALADARRAAKADPDEENGAADHPSIDPLRGSDDAEAAPILHKNTAQ